MIASPYFHSAFFFGVGTLEGRSLSQCWVELKSKFLLVYVVRFSEILKDSLGFFFFQYLSRILFTFQRIIFPLPLASIKDLHLHTRDSFYFLVHCKDLFGFSWRFLTIFLGFLCNEILSFETFQWFTVKDLIQILWDPFSFFRILMIFGIPLGFFEICMIS